MCPMGKRKHKAPEPTRAVGPYNLMLAAVKEAKAKASRKKWGAAARSYEKALHMARRLRAAELIAELAEKAGNAWMRNSEYEKAGESYLEGAHMLGSFASSNGIRVVRESSRLFDLAGDAYRRAGKLFKAGNSYGHAGAVLHANGLDIEKGMKFHERAIEIFEAGDKLEGRCTDGDILYKWGNWARTLSGHHSGRMVSEDWAEKARQAGRRLGKLQRRE